MADQLKQKIDAIRLYSINENASEVERELKKRYGAHALNRRTIGRLNIQFNNTGSILPKIPPGRPRSVRTDINKEIVISELSTQGMNPLSTRRMSQVTNISRGTIRRILKDLKARPYILRLRQALSEDDFDRRMETCENICNLIDMDLGLQDRILWSDESKFTLSGHVNRHNCVIWATENPHFTVDHHFQAPGLMVWAGISSQGIVGPVFIDGNLNGEKYLQLLEEHVFPLNDGEMWFMQDGAPPHYAVAVRDALDNEIEDRWIGRRGPVEWSPRSPDLTPCDFFLWGYLKDKVYGRSPKTIEDLRQYIQEECAAIPLEICENVCRSVRSRMKECIRLEGKHFEDLK